MLCRNCNQEFDHLAKGADRELCRSCRGNDAGRVAGPRSAPTEPTLESDGPTLASGMKECPACAEPIRERALLCRYCGHDVRVPVPQGDRRRPPRARESRLRPGALPLVKSPALAACLSFLCGGLGQLYCGRIGRGLAIMIGPFVLALVFVFGHLASPSVALLFPIVYVGALIFYVWQIFDAYQCAQQTNRSLTRAPRARRQARGTRRRSRRRRVSAR